MERVHHVHTVVGILGYYLPVIHLIFVLFLYIINTTYPKGATHLSFYTHAVIKTTNIYVQKLD